MYSNYDQFQPPDAHRGGAVRSDDKFAKVKDPLLAVVRWLRTR